MQPKAPNEIDRLVGSRVREQRMKLGISQEQLAGELGITVPQVQKYEKGTNRIGASRLHKIASVFGTSISSFFGRHDSSRAGEAGVTGAEASNLLDPSVFADRQTVELALAFSRIMHPEVRRALLDLARAAAHLDPGSSDTNG